MDKRKHIVLVTTWFYPVNRVACYRMNSFAKYFDTQKYKISVVTITGEENLLYRDQHFNAEIYRVPSNKLIRKRRQKTSDNWFVHKLKSLNNVIVGKISKEDYPGWSKNATKELFKLHLNNPIDLLISSYAPVDAHLATLKFFDANPEVKWIADMRDEMSKNPFISAAEKERLNLVEIELAKRIDGLTSVSKPILEGFEEIMKNDKIQYLEVRNGFDHNKKPYRNFNDTFTLLYAGTFYGKRKPDTLFEALLSLKAKGELPEDWKFQLLGTHANFPIPVELKAHLEFLPTADNETAVDMMFKADCNVLIHPPMGVKGVFTGKLFEYVSAHKPILSLVDKKDVAAELIDEQGAGFNADFNNTQEIEEAFLKVYNLWKDREYLPFDKVKVQTLHRQHQAKLMQELIARISEH